ncbi:MAG: 4-hydroxy-3-methylbut-2-enyl diphosphate reductase [Bacteroidaceae bacterium]|nr:4-hydroxy-3-methylbut-2-enyl diphosphate reductase [Bacteroidaceae bacterium]
MRVGIDNDSGFCFGVLSAIGKAEEELRGDGSLYCLGDIVHNGIECKRLSDMGLRTIGHEQFNSLPAGSRVLLRAHGEPPLTYRTAKEHGITLIDATCPVVLKLQQRILAQYNEMNPKEQQIVIFGQKGHAEVLGLVGQTDGNALVIEHADEIDQIDFSKDVFLYSQTTKSAEDYYGLAALIEKRLQPGRKLVTAKTVCGQVSHRSQHIREFASQYDLVLFVSGRKSSNGKVLFGECLEVNPRSYHIENKDDIDFSLFEGIESVGICGATSTPKWLMEECRDHILNHFNNQQ